MTRHPLTEDIQGLNNELARLESQFGLLSGDFYHLYKTGELEQSRSFIQWIGYYEAKLERETFLRTGTEGSK